MRMIFEGKNPVRVGVHVDETRRHGLTGGVEGFVGLRQSVPVSQDGFDLASPDENMTFEPWRSGSVVDGASAHEQSLHGSTSE